MYITVVISTISTFDLVAEDLNVALPTPTLVHHAAVSVSTHYTSFPGSMRLLADWIDRL